MLKLHKKYELWPIESRGSVNDLMDVAPIVRKKWPEAYMEGSVGLARMFVSIVNDKRQFVAYAWSNAFNYKHNAIKWNYLVFKEPHDW